MLYLMNRDKHLTQMMNIYCRYKQQVQKKIKKATNVIFYSILNLAGTGV